MAISPFQGGIVSLAFVDCGRDFGAIALRMERITPVIEWPLVIAVIMRVTKTVQELWRTAYGSGLGGLPSRTLFSGGQKAQVF